MRNVFLSLVFLLGSVASAAAACVSPATMHDFPGASFLMSLSTNGDGNCQSNVALPSWAGGVLGAMANYGTSPGAVLVPGVNAFITNVPAVSQSGTWNVNNIGGTITLPTGAATSANQSTEITALNSIVTNTGAALPPQSVGIPIGGIGLCDGANGATNPCTTKATVKAASTSPALTDTALVVAQSPNPAPVCTGVIAINQTTSTDLKTMTNFGYICSVVLVSATAQNISLTEGTGSICATGAGALIGGTTASVAVSANGGFSAVASSPWLKMLVSADHLCLLQSGGGNVSGVITYQDHS